MKQNSTKLNKVKIIFALILAAVMAFVLGSSVMAYLTQSIVQDWETNIEIQTVVFRFNGKTYLDEIGSSQLIFVKGKPLQVDLEIDTLGSPKIIVDYTLSFQLQTPDGSTAGVSEVTNAIEVYYFNGTRYVFLCMLSDIGSAEITGQMVTDHDETVPLQFVYSAEASEYYDGLVNDSLGQFKIVASATASVNAGTSEYVFASDYEEFAELFTSADTAGETIILLDDMTVTSALTTNYKVGIDLNGYTLTLSHNLNISYSNCDAQIGLCNSGAYVDGVKSGGLAGSGKINISGDDCYLIDNNISTARFTLSMTNASGIFDDFVSIVKTRAQTLSDGTIYTAGSDVSFIFDDLSYYNTLFNFAAESGSLISYNPTAAQYQISISSDVTDRYYYAFTYEYNEVHYAAVSGNAVVRGNSLVAVKDYLAGQLPSVITSGLFLRGYDEVSGSYISWEIDDGYGGKLLNSEGAYRTEGLDELLSLLENYGNKQVDITLKLTKGAETSSFLITKTVRPLSAEEITALIFDNSPVVLTVDSNSTYDVYEDYLSSNLLTKAGLTAISITEVASTDPDNYLVIGQNASDSSFDTVAINTSAFIPQNSLTTVSYQITFTYGSYSYTISKQIIVAGRIADVTEFDMGYHLQSLFSNNEYIDQTAYSFYAYGGLSPRTSGETVNVYIDYFFEFAENTFNSENGYTAANGYFTTTNVNPAKDFIITTEEYLEVAYAEMSSGNQVAYFTYDSVTGEYVTASPDSVTGLYDPSLTYYERLINVEVMPSRITFEEDDTVTIYAVLYTDIIDGQKIYVNPYNDEQTFLTYTMTLDIYGVYANNSSHIVEYNLYRVLCSCFDSNNDGIITRREADVSWETVCDSGSDYLDSLTIGSNTYYYIDLTNLDIENIKGIEYFPNIQGLRLSSNNLVDVTLLSELDNLEYLDLSDNLITDISSLSYMDSLEYLNLADNSITSIEPLRYLPSLSVLSLADNSILDFDPLTVGTDFTSIDLTGLTTANGMQFTVDRNAMYSFALITINNPSVSFTYGSTISISNELKVAAMVIRDLQDINRAHKTLYLPNSYYYYDGTTVNQYTLNWVCDDESIGFIRDINGVCVGYNMPDLLFEKEISIRVEVRSISDPTSYYSLSRSFVIMLEPFETTSDIYIYNGTGYSAATTVVPDVTLLNLLFEEFNNITTGSVTINGASISESQVISAADFTYYLSNYNLLVDWSNKGITNLTGIGLFASLLRHSLNLSGNAIVSLTPLTELTLLTGLTLGGQEYDFTQLYTLSSLTSLDVHECYNLSAQQTLNHLYQIYWNNTGVTIYIEAGKAWQPYAKLLPKAIQNLNSTASFVHRLDTYNIYGDNGETKFTFSMYGKDFDFTVSSVSFYQWELTSASVTGFFSRNGSVITYSSVSTSINMYGKSESAYAKVTLASADSHGAITYADYYIQLNVDDTGKRIIVFNVSGDGRFVASSVDEIFTARYIRETVLSALYYRFSANLCALSYNATYDDNNNGVIDPAEITVDFLKSDSRTVSNATCYNSFYYCAETDCYYITTDAFKTLGTGETSTGISALPTTAGVVDSVYAGDGHLLDGLRYLTNIKSLYFHRDFHFGDGSELINATSLQFQYSAVDLTTLTTTLPNLQTLTIKNCYLFSAVYEDKNGAKTSGFSYMPNLQSLTIAKNGSGKEINDFYFLLGLIDGQGESSLKTLDLTSLRSDYGNYGITSENAEYVNALYQAAVKKGVSPSYKVGSPTSNSNTSGYFRVIDGVADINDDGIMDDDVSCYCTANTDASFSSYWGAALTFTLEVSELEDYNLAVAKMHDLGLKIGNDFWVEDKVFTLTTSDTLTFPSSTGENYYGLSFAGDTNTIERDYPISWVYYFTSNGTSVSNGTLTGASLDSAINIYNTYGNGYFVAIGTINSGISGANDYSYFYHFVVGSGDDTYSTVSDETLRAWLFSRRNSTTNTITIDGKLNNGNILSGISSSYKALPRTSTYSNYIFNLTGINTVLSAWGKLTSITTINLTNQKFSDISPLRTISSLQTLNLSCTGEDQIGYAKLTGLSGYLPNLVSLNLRNNISITPDDIAILATVARANLTTLNLYDTRCMGNYAVLSSIKTIVDGTTNNSLSLALNNSTANSISLAALTAFLDAVNDGNAATSSLLETFISGGINQNADIIRSTQSLVVSGNTYNISLQEQLSSFISVKGADISSGTVAIKMMISATSLNAQFENIFVDSTYTYSGSGNNMLLGSGGANISNFDTQLIAYLYNNSCLTQNGDGYWMLNQTVSINQELGIATMSNASTLAASGSGYGLSITSGSNKLYYSEEGAITTGLVYSDYSKPITFSESEIESIVYLSLLSNYTFSNTSYLPYSAILPTHLWIKGTSYPITWSVLNKTYSDFFSGGISTDLIFTLNGASNGNVYRSSAGTSTLTVRATIDGNTKTKNISIIKTGTVRDYNLYLQVTVIQTGESYLGTNGATYNTVGDVVLLNGDNLVYYYLGASPYSVLYYKNNTYYANLADTTGATEVHVVTPNIIFQSGRFIHHIFVTMTTISQEVVNATTNNYYGKIITTSRLLSTTSLAVSAGNETSTQGITSIEGIQVFCNLTHLTFFGGNWTSVEPLRSLHLVSFLYFNSEAGGTRYDYIVSDFSPLLDGSKNSLQIFGYNALASIQMTDLSFLCGFTNLQQAFICCSNIYPTYPHYGAAYLKTSSFQYVLSHLNANGVKVYVAEGVINAFNLKHDEAQSIIVKVSGGTNTYYVEFLNSGTGYLNYALLPEMEYAQAAQTLEAFASDNTAITYSDNYNLIVNSAAYTTNNNHVTFNLPATINKDGSLYLIDWRTASANVAVTSGYYLTNGVNIGGVSYSAGVALTEAEAQTIISSTEYYTYLKNGTTKLYVSVTANVAQIENLGDYIGTRLICRITLDGYAYERMLSVEFS